MKFQSVHKKISNFIHDRQGFTLAELLIVVAILGILAAFGAVSVYRYQKNLHLTEMDDTAREIFAAAQNNLTNASADGGWENFYVTTDDNGNPLQENDLTVKYGEKINTKPSDYPDDMKWTDGSHDYRYIFINSDHADAYKDLMNQLLPSGSIDDTILPSSGNHHAIVIEYDAKTAIIYGVWYTDGKTGTFSSAQDITAQKMDEVRANGNGRPNLDPDSKISKDAKLYRRDKVKPQVGYYGGGASLGGDGKNVDSLQPMATVVNADELYVRVKLPSDSDKINTSITVYGDTSRKKQTLSFFKVKRSAKNNKQVKWSWYETEDHKRLSEKTSSAVYACYLLDSVTGNTENHFASQFGSNDNAFIPGENLTITVKNAVGARTREKVLHTNSLFDSIRNAGSGSSISGKNTDEAKKYTAVIRYGRQLQNLSTAVSNVNAKNTDRLTVTGVRLAENIDWSKFYYSYGDTPKQNLKSETRGQSAQTSDSARLKNTTDEINLYKQSDNISQGKTGSTAFYSIVNDSLTSIDGRNHTISNLEIQKDRTDDTQGIGLIAGTKSNLTIKKLKIQDPSFTTKDNLGKAEYAGVFVGESSDSKLTIQNAQLIVSDGHSLAVTGENDAGLIAGRVTGNSSEFSLKDVQIDLDGNRKSSVLAGNTSDDDRQGNAGGFTGYTQGKVVIDDCKLTSDSDLEIKAQSNSENRDGNGNAGGVIGFADNCKPNVNRITISLPDESTSSQGEQPRETNGISVYANNNAGGVFGLLSVSADGGSIYNVQYDSGANGVVRANARAAGGFAGRLESNNLRISDVGVTTYIFLDGTNNNVGRAGGFIGYLDSGDSGSTYLTRCYYGGRTRNQSANKQSYDLSQPGFDGSTFHPGGYNIVNKSKNIQTAAGGFLGAVSSDKKNPVNIIACYTTGSVYINQGSVGGFVGKASASDSQSAFVLNYTYATGAVDAADKNNSNIGTFSGRYGISSNSRNNYYLKGVNDPSIYAIGNAGNRNSIRDKAEIISDNQTVIGEERLGSGVFASVTGHEHSAETYDISLKGNNYPFHFVTDLSNEVETDSESGISEAAKAALKNNINSILKQYFGDWPAAVWMTDRSFDHDFAILYYEKVQHGTAKNSFNWYYHGYCADTSPSGTMDYQEISTTNTLNSPGPMSRRGLLTAPNGGEYVAEDGYIILVDEDYNNELDKVAIANHWNRMTLKDAETNRVLIEYDDILNSLNIRGYKAYFLNPDNSYYSAWNADKPFDFCKETEETKNSIWNWNTCAQFHYLPVFADCISPGQEGLPADEVRSASQLHWLLDGKLGEQYFGNSGRRQTVTQTMDIDFSSDDVAFTFKGESVSYNKTPYFASKLTGVYQGAAKKQGFYSLKNLNQTFIDSIDNGKFQNLTIENFNSAGGLVNHIKWGNGSINHVTINNAVVKATNSQTGIIVNNESSGKISDCTINSSSVEGNGLVGGASSGTISNCELNDVLISGNGFASTISGTSNASNQLKNVIISGNGVADTISGNISSSNIVNAFIEKNGFANTFSDGSSISNCHIFSDETKLPKSPVYFVNNANQAKGYDLIRIGMNSQNAQLADTDIAGFVGTSRGTISNCSVTGTIYSNKNIGGFVLDAYGDISDSYANTIINATGDGAGFAYKVESYGKKLSGDHSLGVINANTAAGFALNVSGNSFENCYSAEWQAVVRNTYYRFANGGYSYTNCYYLQSNSEDNVIVPSGVSAVDSVGLNALTAQLGAANEGNTHPYGQYLEAADAKVYPYPAGNISDNYGDWGSVLTVIVNQPSENIPRSFWMDGIRSSIFLNRYGPNHFYSFFRYLIYLKKDNNDSEYIIPVSGITYNYSWISNNCDVDPSYIYTNSTFSQSATKTIFVPSGAVIYNDSKFYLNLVSSNYSMESFMNSSGNYIQLN